MRRAVEGKGPFSMFAGYSPRPHSETWGVLAIEREPSIWTILSSSSSRRDLKVSPSYAVVGVLELSGRGPALLVLNPGRTELLLMSAIGSESLVSERAPVDAIGVSLARPVIAYSVANELIVCDLDR